MDQDINIELPLYRSFIELMQLEKNQSSKGIDLNSYFTLIKTLRDGYMLNSEEDLLFFCKKLWLKPFHLNNPVVNEKELEQIIKKNLAAYGFPTGEKPAPIDETKRSDDTTKLKPGDNQDNNESKEPEPGKSKKADTEVIQPEKPKTIPLVLNIEEGAADQTLQERDYGDFFNDKKFQFNYEYLPVSKRFIEQTIRSLRYKVKGMGRPVIDIETTVKVIAQKGFFDSWQTREEDDFVTRWTLVFDHGGSMLAFQDLQNALVEAAFNGSMKNDGDVFYFRNVAEDFLYTNLQRTRSISFDRMANGPRRNILIVSDAGAARGKYNEDRVQDTYTMLYYLRKHRVAWLNPLPKQRWEKSSAVAIAEFVNMFEPGDDYSDDLGNIVQLLKSKIITRTAL